MKHTILVCAAALFAVLLTTHVFAEEGLPQQLPESPLEEGLPPTPEPFPEQGLPPTVEPIQVSPLPGPPLETPVTETGTVITQAITTTVVVTTITAVTRVQVLTETEPVVQLVITDTLAPARVTLNLDTDYTLDPFLVSVQAGGPFSAVGLGPGCAGYVTSAPTVSIHWNGIATFLETFFYSDHDPTLIMQTPSGQIICNDDANDVLLDPVIRLEAPVSGLYHIWVGSFARNQVIPGLLVFSRNPAVNIGTFRPGSLVQREPLPENVVYPALVRTTALPTVTTRVAEMGMAALQPGSAPVNIPVAVNGTVPAFDLPIRGALCPGFINNFIDYSFTWSGTTANLRLFVEGDSDSSLLVVGPGDTVYCNDDVAGPDNLNPMVNIVNPPTGTFLVYVGRINPEVPMSGMLTVVESSDLMPVVLTALP